MEHKKRVRIFRQNETMETCVCCCVLMVLDYYRLLPGGSPYPTKGMEDVLYRCLGYQLEGFDGADKRFTRGTPLSAAAYVLLQKGLDVAVYHSQRELLCNTCSGSPYYPEEIFPAVLEKYQSWITRAGGGLEQKLCTELNCGLLKKLLDEEKLLVAACVVDSDEGDTLHGVVVDFYRQEAGRTEFHLCNPASGKHFLDGGELLERMDTPVGIHFLAAGARRAV